MNWVNQGLIFSPFEHLSTEYAQGPQAILFEDRTRVYFSTRIRDESKKFVSQVNFVDFSPDFKEIIKVSKKPCISPGELGSFDEHGIFPFSPFRRNGELLAYTCGWSRRVSVDIEMAIGLAVSADNGETFQRVGNGPVLSGSQNEPFLIGDPFVLIKNQNLELFYIFGTQWQKSTGGVPERTYRIASLMSNDEKNLLRNSDGRQIISVKTQTEAQAMPTVFSVGKSDFMLFCYRDTFDFRGTTSTGAYRLGFASRTNDANWIRDDSRVPKINDNTSDFENSMQCYPNAHLRNGKVFLLYNGDEFGKFGFNLATLDLT